MKVKKKQGGIFRKKKYAYAIEIKERSVPEIGIIVKLWHISRHQGSPVVTLLQQTIMPALTEEGVKELVSVYEEKYHISQEDVGLFLPRASYVIRFLDLPCVKEKDLRAMVGLQVGHMLPYDASEVIFDFLVYDTPKEGCVRVALFIITKQVLEKFSLPLKTLHILPTFVLPSTQLISNFFLAGVHNPDAGGFNIFIDIDDSVVEMVVLRKTEILLTRSFSLSANNTEKFVKEVRFTLEKEFQNILKMDAVNAVLMSDHPIAAELESNIRQLYPAAQVGIVDAEALHVCVNGTNLSDGRTVNSSTSVGYVLSKDAETVNLLPTAVAEMRGKQLFLQKYKWTCILTIIALIVAGAYFVVDYSMKSQALDAVRQKQERISSEVTKVREVMRGLHVVETVALRKRVPLQALHAMYEVIPSGMYLTFFEYSVHDGLKVRGMASQFSDVSDLVIALQAVPMFDAVEMKFAKKRLEGAEEFTDFQIDCRVKDDMRYGQKNI